MQRLLDSLATAFRIALSAIALAVVVWAFSFVGLRWWHEHRGTLTGANVKLTMLYWDDVEQGPVTRGLLTRYLAQHAEVQLEQIHCDPGNFPTKLRTMFAAGDPPDLFFLQPHMLAPLSTMHLIRPLDAFTESDHRTGHGAWLDDMYPLLLNSFRYDGKRDGVGPLYGIAKDFTTCVMWVNVDLFKKAGVPVPYDGWTWDEYESAMKRITALSTPQHHVYGGSLELWDDTFRALLWTYGADFFADRRGQPDFTDVALNRPAALAAMDMVRRVRLQDQTVYNATGVAKDDSESFFDGEIGALGPIGRWKTPQWRLIKNFTVDCVPVPHAANVAPAAMIITNAWAISQHCRSPQAAYDLVRFMCGPDGQTQMSRLGLAIPTLRSVAQSDAFLSPGLVPAHAQVFLDAVNVGRLQQIPPDEAQWQQILNSEVLERSLQLGLATPSAAANAAAERWSALLHSPMEQTFPPMRWGLAWSAVAGAAALAGAGGILWTRRRQGRFTTRFGRDGWLFISPWLLGFLCLTLGPMLLSLMLSLTKWTAMTPLSGAQFVGLENFRQFLRHDPLLGQSLKVTAWFVVLSVPLVQATSLGVALLMNSRVRGIALFRTAYFVPSVVSGVALATLWLWIFNKEFGLLNALLRPILRPLGLVPPDWFGTDAPRWAIPAFVLMALWGVGSGMVIYLAGLKGVPASLYEAATLDGAGPAQRLFNVTLPMLSPLIFFNLVMALIGSFQVFTQAQVMTAGGPNNATLFYVLDLYREAFEYQNMGYASAMAWLLFLIILALTLMVFRAARGLVYYEGLKA